MAKSWGKWAREGEIFLFFSTRGLATKPTPIVRTVIHEPFFAANAEGGQIEIDSLDKNELILAKIRGKIRCKTSEEQWRSRGSYERCLIFFLFPVPILGFVSRFRVCEAHLTVWWASWSVNLAPFEPNRGHISRCNVVYDHNTYGLAHDAVEINWG